MPKKLAKALLKQLLPPIAWDAVRHARAVVSPPANGWFECNDGPRAFAKAASHWNGAEIARTYERRWPGYQRVVSTAVPPVFASETDAFAFDPKVDLFSAAHLMRQNAILGLVFAVSRAARQRPGISMLDWGGGVGHQYGLVRALLPDLKLETTCFDLPVSVEFGSKHFPEVAFTSDFKCLEQRYDLVVANGSLHCFEQWEQVLEQLATATREFCFITMLPVRLDGPSMVVTQRWINPDGSSYAEPEWFVSREEVLRKFPSSTWKLHRELICGYSPRIYDSDARVDYRGFLFERVGG